jgi:NADH-quinone oxidoreductase subunit I
MSVIGSALLQGMSVTAKNFVGSYFDKDRMTTIQYPEERKAPEENYRNFPFLVFDKDADHLRCVACKICETECPPQCIYIEVMRDAAGKVVKQPKVFDIDYSVCMGCQICVEACPFDAIKMDQNYELATDDRFGGLLIDKQGLARSNEYYHTIKPTEAAEVDARLAADAAKKKKPAAATPAAKPAAKPAAATAAPAAPQLMPINVPPDAPFNAEQREWLQKLFSQFGGVAGGAPRPAATAAAPAAGEAAPAAEEAPAEAENPDLTNDAPWHDPEKDLASRMKMAEGKPLAVKLYAAMGQTDCTACGYDCKGYAQALAAGTEKDPGLCVPGADETAAKVKDLMEAAGMKV